VIDITTNRGNDMNDISIFSKGPITMNSLDFLNQIINPARTEYGEREVKNTNFSAKIEDELDDLPAVKIIYRFGNEMRTYDLTIEQLTLVGMRESKAVRRQVLEKLKAIDNKAKPAIPQTYAAALLEAGRLALEVEKQAEQLLLAKPKVEFVDKFTSKDALQNATQVGQTLKMSAVKLNRTLDELGGIYNKSVKRGRVFCLSWVVDGYGKMVQSEAGYPQAMFTTSGVVRVTELLTTNGVI